MTSEQRARRCTEIADQVVPAYRYGKRSYSCSSWTAKRWQAAWDAACLAHGVDLSEGRS
jgi:endonuclease I